jgi:F-type H+-transporting ATPase subunit epsilon
MKLRVLLPARILLETGPVDCISAEAENGSFSLLPHHVDNVTSLATGILSYRDRDGEGFVSVDGGILVKKGDMVTISTEHAVRGQELGQLKETILRQSEAAAGSERRSRTAVQQLEAGFVRKLVELTHEQK